MPAFVRVEREEKGVAVIWLQREPVNTLNLEVWQQVLALAAHDSALSQQLA